MTNQNDTQDEAERLAEEFIILERERSGIEDFQSLVAFDRSIKSVFIKGYRAGQTSRDEMMKQMREGVARYPSMVDEALAQRDALREENSRLKESLSAVTVIQQRDAAIKELAASRAEVEELKQWGQRRAEKAFILDAKLAAEKAWSKSAFDCLNRGAEIMTLDQLGSWTGVRAVIESYDSADQEPSPADKDEA